MQNLLVFIMEAHCSLWGMKWIVIYSRLILVFKGLKNMFFLGFQCTSYRFIYLILACFRLIQNYTFHHSSLQHNPHTVTWSSTELEVVRGGSKLMWNTEKLYLQWHVLPMIYNLIPLPILYGYMKSTPYQSTQKHCLCFYIFP